MSSERAVAQVVKNAIGTSTLSQEEKANVWLELAGSCIQAAFEAENALSPTVSEWHQRRAIVLEDSVNRVLHRWLAAQVQKDPDETAAVLAVAERCYAALPSQTGLPADVVPNLMPRITQRVIREETKRANSRPTPALVKRCPWCAEEIQAAAVLCRFCGRELLARPRSEPGNRMTRLAPTPTSTNGYAIASLVLGLTWPSGVGPILAVIFGHIARAEIRRSRGSQSGDGMAVAGLVFGYIGIVAFLVIIIILFGLIGSSNSGSSY